MSMELAGELGYIKRGSKPTIGVDLKAASGIRHGDVRMRRCQRNHRQRRRHGHAARTPRLVIGKAGKLDAMVKNRSRSGTRSAPRLKCVKSEASGREHDKLTSTTS